MIVLCSVLDVHKPPVQPCAPHALISDMTQCAERRQIQEARKEDPELERVLGNAQTQDEVSAKMEEHLQSDPEPTLLQPKLGSTERMRVLFRAYDPAMTYVRPLSTDWDVETSTARGLLLVPTMMHATPLHATRPRHCMRNSAQNVQTCILPWQ